MKKFLYLDQEKTASYLAQAHEGKIIGRKETFSDSNATTESRGPSQIKKTSSVDGSVVFAKGALGIEFLDTGVGTTFLQTESGQEMAEYIIHDDIFERMMLHLEQTKAISEKAKERKYWKTQQIVKFIDIPWSIDLLKSYAEYMDSRTEPEKREKPYESNLPSNIDQMYDTLFRCIPSPCILSSSAFVGFLNQKYLRENSATLMFQYTKPLQVVGFVTGFLKKAPEPDGFYESLQNITSTMIHALTALGINMIDGISLIDPIAVYLDEDAL